MRVSIFYYFNQQVIRGSWILSFTARCTLGLIDGYYTPVEYWEILQHPYSELKFFEYEEILRARVLVNSIHQQMMMYMDAKLFKKSITTQILHFFDLRLESVICKKDPYYKTIKKPPWLGG